MIVFIKQSMEWTTNETMDDEGKTGSPAAIGADLNSAEKNEVIRAEENEWYMHLRVRWEKYQNEEEATLGRGKRVRKTSSYRKNENEKKDPEHTPFGGAQKTKFERHRALVVLALCAPSSSPKKSSKSHKKVNRQVRQRNLSKFPLDTSGCSTSTAAVKRPEAGTSKVRLQETPSGIAPQCLKSRFSDSPLPFPMRKFTDSFASSGASSSDLVEKMGFPSLPSDVRTLPNVPPKTFQSPGPNLLSNLFLGERDGPANVQPHSTMMTVPNLTLPVQDMPYSYQGEFPTSSLGRMPNTCPPITENQQKLLYDLALRNGLGGSHLLKRNWESMPGDPRLNLPQFKSPNELASWWEEEQVKIWVSRPWRSDDGQALSRESALLPNIADDMFARAQQGSMLRGGTNFQNQSTDMKHGFPGPPLNRHPFEAANYAHIHAANLAAFQGFGPGIFPANFSGDPSAFFSGVSVPMEPSMLRSTFEYSNMGVHNELGGNIYPHGPLNDMGTSSSNVQPSASSFLPNPSDETDHSRRKGKEIATDDNSVKEKLPHWLREALAATPPMTQNYELPPASSLGLPQYDPGDSSRSEKNARNNQGGNWYS